MPFVCLFAPELLLVGTPLGIIESAVTAIIGVIILAAGLEGYLIKDANIVERVLYIVGGALLFYPGLTTDAIGAAAAVVAVALQFIRKKKST